MTRPTENTATRLQRQLTTEILRGVYPVGSRLPPVRELARDFDINPATVQRALARLEATGLVSARQGSGVKVNDPAIAGDISLVPAWLEALGDQPARAAEVLSDFLEVRRILACRLFVRHRHRLAERAGELGAAAQRFLEATEMGAEALCEADLAFVRTLLQCTGNRVALAVLNTVARVITDVPHVAEAMYGDPGANADSMREVMGALATLDGAALAAAVETTLETVDEGTVRRYEAALTAQLSGGS